MTRGILIALFAVTVFANVALVKLTVGLPVRSLLLLLMLVLLEWQFPQLVIDTLIKCRTFILVTIYLAVVGLILTFANGDSPAAAISVLIESYVQTLITVLVVYLMASIVGLGATSAVIALVIFLSMGFAYLQILGNDWAWQLKYDIDVATGAIPQTPTPRAPGLSFSVVHLGGQSLVLFAIAVIWSMVKRTPFHIVVGLILVTLTAFACGNRSPLLSVLVFTAFLMWRIYPRQSLAYGPLIALIAVPSLSWVLGVLEEAEVRAADAADSSSVGRIVLNYYAFLLLRDNWFGHGLLFDSKLHWTKYWSSINWLENATIVQRYGLHNYFMNMATNFGVFLIPVLLILRGKPRLVNLIFWTFIAYFINALTHNEGPFYGDNIFWYGAGCVMFLLHHSELVFNRETLTRPNPSTQRYGAPAPQSA